MCRYNLAYYPSGDGFARQCVAFAGRFAMDADGYCLNGRDAFPHLTLCQFRADESRLESVWRQALPFAPPRDIVFGNIHCRPGRGDQTGYVWVEVPVRREASLMECQNTIAALLMDASLKTLTGMISDYHPHLTFARLRNRPTSLPVWVGELERPHAFHLTLGLSSDIGVYMKTIYPR